MFHVELYCKVCGKYHKLPFCGVVKKKKEWIKPEIRVYRRVLANVSQEKDDGVVNKMANKKRDRKEYMREYMKRKRSKG